MKRDAANFQVARQQAAPRPIPISAHQLAGRHARLLRELAQAYGTQPWPAPLIDRLANELAATEREMAKPRSEDCPGV